MRFYITTDNKLFILDELSQEHRNFIDELISFYDKDPEWPVLGDHWLKEIIEKFDFEKIWGLPILKICQDLESRIGIKQGFIQKPVDMSEDFITEDIDMLIGYYHAKVKGDEGNGMLYRILGLLYSKLPVPDYEKAKCYMKKAITNVSDYGQSHLDLGRIYLLQEEIDKAKVEQKKLEEIGSKLCAELRKDIKKAEAG